MCIFQSIILINQMFQYMKSIEVCESLFTENPTYSVLSEYDRNKQCINYLVRIYYWGDRYIYSDNLWIDPINLIIINTLIRF